MWCIGKITAEYRRRMYDLLELYARDYCEERPVICVDEKSKQLLAETREPLRVRTGSSRKEDYEYKRCGTRNIFVFVEPLTGQRHVLVTLHRTKEDFAKAMRYLVQVLYPLALTIHLVLDHLNTHTIEIFRMPEAAPIVSRLKFHYTPLHASWTNIAEIELSALTRHCLDRRIADEWTSGRTPATSRSSGC